MIRILSLSSSASSKCQVDTNTLSSLESFQTSFLITRKMFILDKRSRFDVGSSNISNFGFPISAKHIESFLFPPGDSILASYSIWLLLMSTSSAILLIYYSLNLIPSNLIFISICSLTVSSSQKISVCGQNLICYLKL